jgi:hypothetical protein
VLVVDEVLDPQVEDAGALLNVPDTGRLVAGARDEESPISAEVQRVDLLHVALEKVADALLLDVPDLGVSWRKGLLLTLIWRSSAPVARNLPSGLKQMLRM